MTPEAIKPKWNESARSIIEMGRNLQQMSKELDRDALTKKVNADFGIAASSINKIIRIATHPILSNPVHTDKLPNSWALLYEMRFLPDEVLLEKLKNGELRKASKYKVWDWRGIKTKGPVGYNEGNRVKIPDNVTLAAYVSAGMQREVDFGNDIPAVAKNLGIGDLTYRNVRAIILLSRHPDLSNADSELVQSLIDKINKTRNVREYYLKAKPLIEKIWGSGRNKVFSGKVSQKRVEAYLNSVFLLGVSAQRLSDMDRPYMSIEDADKAINELSEAGTIIRKVAEAIRRSKND
jgi:hypothetical protein